MESLKRLRSLAVVAIAAWMAGCAMLSQYLLMSDQIRKDLAEKGRVSLQINFENDSAEVRGDSERQLEEIGKALKDIAFETDAYVEVVGHTDNKGSAAYNLDLSKRRAASVVSALVTRYQVPDAIVRSDGKGFTQPVVTPEKTDADRAKNRRVELVYVKPSKPTFKDVARSAGNNLKNGARDVGAGLKEGFKEAGKGFMDNFRRKDAAKDGTAAN